jgi:hypothetical protein
LAEETHVSEEEYGQTKSYEGGTILDGLYPAAAAAAAAAHDDDDDDDDE